jgi:hypothetical protein
MYAKRGRKGGWSKTVKREKTLWKVEYFLAGQNVKHK